MDWENERYVLHVSSLDHWCSRVLGLMESFNTILIKYIYCELNGMVDEISRREVGDIQGLQDT